MALTPLSQLLQPQRSQPQAPQKQPATKRPTYASAIKDPAVHDALRRAGIDPHLAIKQFNKLAARQKMEPDEFYEKIMSHPKMRRHLGASASR